MEESHNPDIEAEIADAIEPSERSELGSEGDTDKLNTVKYIEYNGWKCRLVKEGRKWMIYIDGEPTHLQQFADEQNVNLELHNNLLCLRVDCGLYLLTILKDGKANTTLWSTVGNASTSTRTTENQRPTEIQTEMLTGLEPTEKERQTLSCKSQNDCVKLLKGRNKWSLSFGRKETILDFDENAVVSLETNAEDTYIQADGSLYEVFIDSVGDITVKKIPEAIVVDKSTIDKSSKYECGKRSNAASDERYASGSLECDLETISKQEKDSSKSQSLRLHTENAPKPHDTMLTQSLHSRVTDFPPAGKGDIMPDRKMDTTAGITNSESEADNRIYRDTNQNIPETMKPMFPDDKNAPSNISSEYTAPNKKNNEEMLNTSNTLLAGANHRNEGQTGTGNTKDSGAIPKTTKLESRTLCRDDGHGLSASWRTSANGSTQDEGSLNDIKQQQPDDQLDHSKVQRKKPDSEKDKESKQRPIVSTAVRVDDDRVFDFLTTSKIIKGMTDVNKVKIVPRKISGHQGFEISGVPESMQKTEKAMKDILMKTTTETFTLEATDSSTAMISGCITSLESRLGEKFDVLTKFAVNEGKTEGRTKSCTNATEEKVDNKSEHKQVILKMQTPKSVMWHFPRGYNISLYNKPIEETTASVIVRFTQWNGENKQITNSKSPDGIGGFLYHVSVGLPVCTDTKANADALKELLCKVLLKTGEAEKSSISFSLQNIQNWSCSAFVDCLLTVTWEHFRAQTKDKPVFVELCSPRADEYQAALFQCLRAVTEMEKDVESLHIEELKTEIVEGKLNLIKAEVLVNTTSPTLHLNAGAVSAALLKTAGDNLQDDCRQFYPKGIQWGEIAVTYGHGLSCNYVFHGALPAFLLDQHKMSEGEKFTAFRNLMEACLTKASELGCRSIAFPVLGTGNLKYPVDLVASEMLISIEKFQMRYPRSTLRVVYIVVYQSDKYALQKCRRLQAELKVDTSKQSQQEASCSDEPGEDEENVESVTVELTGLQYDVDNTREFIKKQWKKSASNNERAFKFRLSHSLGEYICRREEGRLTQDLEDMGADISKVESQYYATTHTFEGLKDAFTLIDKFSVNTFGTGHSLGQFEELCVIVELHDISTLDFKVMEKTNQSTLRKYDRDGVRLKHERNSMFINGKAKYVEPVLNEIEKLLVYVHKFEVLCIDGVQRNIPKSLMTKLANELDTDMVGKHDRCVLFNQTQNKLHLFARSERDLLNTRKEFLDETLGKNKEQAERSPKAETRQPNQGEKLADNHWTRLKTIKPILIKSKHGIVKLFIYKDNLLETPVECIVSAANEHLTHNAGVAAAIAHAAGSELMMETDSYYKRRGRVPAGDVVKTAAGNLKQKYKCILHAVGPNWRDYQPITRDKLDHCKLAVQSVVHKCLYLAGRDKLKSVAMPAISAGYQGVPSDICALQYAEGISRYLDNTKRPIVEEIHFVDLNDDTIQQINQTFDDYFVKGKVINVDSRYIIDKSVTASTNVNVKMTGCPKNGREESKLRDVSKSEAAEQHARSNTETTSGGSSVKEKTKPGRTILENPTVWESPSKATIIQFTTKQELQLYTANIVELHTIDAIVVCEEPSGTNSGLITRQLLVKGAAKYIGERGKAFHSKRNLSFGDVVVTSGGDSQFKLVFHALLHQRHMFPDLSKWYDAFQKTLGLIFQKAVLMKCSSIAMPVMGTDSKTQDISGYADRFIQSYKAFCLAKPTQELAVHLISSEPTLTKTLRALFERHVLGKQRLSSSAAAHQPSVQEVTNDSKTIEEKSPPKHVKENEAADCVICLDKLENPLKLKCGHVFCKECISQHLKTKQNCPVCGRVFGKLTGNQPPGEMKKEVIPDALPGYESCKTIRIVYVFNNGVQGPEHPEPGQPYTGISRVALLPDNDEGRKILKLLQIAFKRRLTFTIGQSRTTGHTGVITWNDIHHKTDYRPNTQFGYPDPTYFDRVKDELAAKGVTEDDLK